MTQSRSENSITVYGKPDGTAEFTLTNKIGEGGQGVIYADVLDNEREIACKIFNDKQPPGLAEKIRRMVNIGRENYEELVKPPNIAWPQLVIYDEEGEFIGYAMKRAEGEPLAKLAHPMSGPEKFPDIDRDKVAKMLISIWETVDVLHRQNIFIGDVNLGNFLCTPDYKPCLIDVDSYQVEEWKCPVGRPEMTPPEHLDGHYEEITRTRESDLYSLAILSFQCFMLGKHPFEHIGGGTGLENQREGRMPYLKGCGAPPGRKGGVPKGPWWTYWSNYPYDIKELFADALEKGGHNPKDRPAPEKWISTLKAYRSKLTNPAAKLPSGELFQHTADIKPDEPKPKLDKLSKEESRLVKKRELRYNTARQEAAQAPIEVLDLLHNPTPRIIISLVVDASSGMARQQMDNMNAGLRMFIEKVNKDDFARFSAEVEVFVCGGEVSHFSAKEGDDWRDFSANGGACLGAGMKDALQVTSARMEELKESGISAYKPWLVLLTANDPEDDCTDVLEKLARVNKSDQPVEVFVVGMGAGYVRETLAQFSPPDREPQRVGEQKLDAFFDWLALSMSEVSQSVPTYNRNLPSISSWVAQ